MKKEENGDNEDVDNEEQIRDMIFKNNDDASIEMIINESSL